MRIILALFVLLVGTSIARAEPVAFAIDADKSDLGFVFFFGDDPVRGRFPRFGANILVDFDSVSKSSVEVVIDATRASTGIPPATEAMRGDKVLDTDQFPTISFVSKRVELGPHPTIIVTGDLTVRDVTQEISFTGTLLVEDAEQLELRERLVIRLKGEISRSAFGASGFADMVADTMELKGDIAIVHKP